MAACLTTGKLLLASRGLSEFPLAQLLGASGALNDWWSLEALKTIDLTDNRIAALPDELRQFAETLQVLRLAGNAISRLPAGLFACAALKSLDLSRNALEGELPDVTGLVGLVELNVSGNKLTGLGKLAGLRFLEILRASDNALRELPVDIGACGLLLEVDASGNKLWGLPPSLEHCKRLKTLLLARNEIVSDGIAEGCIAALASLVHLDMRQNRLTSVPTLPDSPGLSEVQLGINGIREVSAAAIARRTIATLDLSDNAIATLPDGMRVMEALHTLDLRNNDLNVLPPFLGFLPALTRLLADGNPLRTMR